MWWLLFTALAGPVTSAHVIDHGLNAYSSSSQERPPWSYDGLNGPAPNDWPEVFPKCGDSRQSPIALGRPDRVVYVPKGVNNYNIPLEMNLVTTERYIEYCIYEDKGIPLSPQLYHNVTNRYSLFAIHLHFGSDNTEGSEHSVDGKPYQGEFSILFFDHKYGSPMEAARHPDGLLMNSVFLQVANVAENSLFEPLLKQIKESTRRKEGIPVSVDDFIIWSRFRNEDYYSYKGSVTHPPCLNARVNVFHESPPEVYISEKQMAELRSIVGYYGNKYDNTFRPIQPLNQRKVTYVRRDFDEHDELYGVEYRRPGNMKDQNYRRYDGYHRDQDYIRHREDQWDIDHQDYRRHDGSKLYGRRQYSQRDQFY